MGMLSVIVNCELVNNVGEEKRINYCRSKSGELQNCRIAEESL